MRVHIHIQAPPCHTLLGVGVKSSPAIVHASREGAYAICVSLAGEVAHKLQALLLRLQVNLHEEVRADLES